MGGINQSCRPNITTKYTCILRQLQVLILTQMTIRNLSNYTNNDVLRLLTQDGHTFILRPRANVDGCPKSSRDQSTPGNSGVLTCNDF